MGRYKPGLDWTALRACWEAGQSGSSLAKRFNVTRQGIEYRARSEHWQRAARAEGISATATMARIEAPKTHHDRALLALDAKRTPSAMRTILEALANGSTKAMSARLAGISRDSLDGWLEADEGFARLADVASAEFAAGAVKRVKQAGERGEWRADLALLERHPQTRSEWAPNVETPSAAGEGITH